MTSKDKPRIRICPRRVVPSFSYAEWRFVQVSGKLQASPYPLGRRWPKGRMRALTA
jgi:hypothetical protein